ncbi:tyrosine-type recombinase/integrase [Novosphingobium resinovorum]|uniref:Tyr recombinase domain-containing protein n=1 Tax=Novosphingobium resinovorum TaxID=158500 RepID=A0A1D8A3E1_9SPHN|nr:integrase arm-type DNA-binding domain-containing protein [Novosphingobium resinovorum]AOR76586.1 hypothetical protein BES08_07355 [Novosphingobium resinovorum]
MPISDTTCRNAKPRDKAYKLTDSEGLHLLVQTNGSRLWRLAYRFDGKQKTLSLGPYPSVSLAKARELRQEARTQLHLGHDPAEVRKQEVVESSQTFHSVSREWLGLWQVGKDAAHILRVENRLKKDVYPIFGNRHVAGIRAPEILEMLRKVEDRGALDIARRLRQTCDQIFRYAKASGLVENNPASADLLEAMKPKAKVTHMPSLADDELPEFLQRLDRYDGDVLTKDAIWFTLLTWVRTSETRFAEWSEIEGLGGEAPLWRIPAPRMKMGREHLVPLSAAAADVLSRLPRSSRYIFPGLKGKAMSENTMLYGIYRMGYHSRATIHGFRGTASTIANEAGWNKDWVERQLAHVEENKIRGAYNSAEWLPGRRDMMNWWAKLLATRRSQAVDDSLQSAVEDEFSQLLG